MLGAAIKQLDERERRILIERRLREDPLYSISEDILESYLGPRTDGLPWTPDPER